MHQHGNCVFSKLRVERLLSYDCYYLITGIACSYFDSIPTIHITGQVNKAESASFLGANVRQAGFQETNIVDMVKPITKYAVQVSSGVELVQELNKAYKISISGRMGPVLIDVPMDVQQEEVNDEMLMPELALEHFDFDVCKTTINNFFKDSKSATRFIRSRSWAVRSV